MTYKEILDILEGDKESTVIIQPLLEQSGLELRGAARVNDLYRWRLSPYGEKKVLAHFNEPGQIIIYLKELLAI